MKKEGTKWGEAREKTSKGERKGRPVGLFIVSWSWERCLTLCMTFNCDASASALVCGECACQLSFQRRQLFVFCSSVACEWQKTAIWGLLNGASTHLGGGFVMVHGDNRPVLWIPFICFVFAATLKPVCAGLWVMLHLSWFEFIIFIQFITCGT